MGRRKLLSNRERLALFATGSLDAPQARFFHDDGGATSQQRKHLVNIINLVYR
jgi:hypothetical protein